MTATHQDRSRTAPERAIPVPRTAALPADARAFQDHRAGIVTRAAAAAIDAVLMALVVALGYAAVIGVIFLWKPVDFRMPSVPFWLLMVVAGALTTVYLTVCWRATGRTYGELLLGIRVIDRRGKHPSFLRALLRALLCVFVPLGLLWAAVDRRNRSFQDVLLQTSAVYHWHTPDLPHRDVSDVPPTFGHGG